MFINRKFIPSHVICAARLTPQGKVCDITSNAFTKEFVPSVLNAINCFPILEL